MSRKAAFKVLMTPDEISEILKVPRRTVVRKMRDGEFEGAFQLGRLWRISDNDFEKYIKSLQRRK